MMGRVAWEEVRRNAQFQMAHFDALPYALREALRNSPQDWPAHQVYAAWKTGHSVASILDMIDRANRGAL